MGRKAYSYQELIQLIQSGIDTFAEIRTNDIFVLFHKLRIVGNQIEGDSYYPNGNLSGNRNSPSNRTNFNCTFQRSNSQSHIPLTKGNFGNCYFEEYAIGQAVSYAGNFPNYTITVK